jgi:aryl-phospho-beta-D-glucosidase BglC (GH1 family)
MIELHVDPSRTGGPVPAIRGVMTEWMHAAGQVDPGRTVDPEGVEFGYGKLLPLQAEDYRRAAEIGVNTIRTAVEHASLEHRDRPGAWNPEGFARLEQILGWCEQFGIDVVLDLHNALGREGGGDPRLWQQQALQDRFVGVWSELARRYADHPAVVAFEPLNEPEPRHVEDFPARHAVWNTLARRTVEAIRATGTDLPVIIDSIEYASPEMFEGLAPTGDAGTVYSFHWYGPSAFHCQKRPWKSDKGTYHYPDTIKGKWWNRRQIAQAWAPALQFADLHGVDLFCGEFGCVGDVPEMEDMVWLLDVISLFDQLGIGWTYYHYMFRTVEPYWREHFDCNLYVYDQPGDTLRALDRKVSLLSELMRLKGDVLDLAQPSDEMVTVHGAAAGDSMRLYVSNKDREAMRTVRIDGASVPGQARLQVRRMAPSSKGFQRVSAPERTGSGFELQLEPLSIAALDWSC